MPTPETPSESSTPETSDWLGELYASTGLEGNEPIERIGEVMDDLANRTAPVARNFWIWIVGIQSACVIIPVIWFVREPQQLPTLFPAILCLVAILLLIATLWWMRWRGMQRTWAQARLVAEIARARINGGLSADDELHPFLNQFPGLENLPYPENAKRGDWLTRKDAWIENRLFDQLDYYKREKAKAEHQRTRITQGITLMMDVTFSVSIFAVIVFLTNRSEQWWRSFGSQWLDWVIGFLCIAFPLALIALQILRSAWELNRRTAKYERQISMLTCTQSELESCDSEAHAIDLIRNAEQQMLSEVIDWFYETVTAEEFFDVRGSVKRSVVAPSRRIKLINKDVRTGLDRIQKATSVGLRPAKFLIKVILGRLPWVLVAIAFTLAWVSYRAPEDGDQGAQLDELAQLVVANGEPWRPGDSEQAKNGCIIIAHGLDDRAYNAPNEENGNVETSEEHWMDLMEKAIRKAYEDNPEQCPEIARVHWSERAKPGEFADLNPVDIGLILKITGLGGVKNQGKEVGYYLAFRLFQMINEGEIPRDAPLHLIGHSAGGFVVSKAAILLEQTGFAPEQMRVTILDTPQPGKEILRALPLICDVDFYISSSYVVGVGEETASKKMLLKEIHNFSFPFNFFKRLTPEDHRQAYVWYTGTIGAPQEHETGFRLSPFLPGPNSSVEPPPAQP